MKKLFLLSLLLTILCSVAFAQSDKDVIVLHNLTWDKNAPAGFQELIIPSAGSHLQGFMYKPNGKQKHPTLIMLHGYPKPGNRSKLCDCLL